jgi:hypothetical protein
VEQRLKVFENSAERVMGGEREREREREREKIVHGEG